MSDDLKELFPAHTLSPDLEQRVARMAAAHADDAAVRRRKSVGLRLGAVGGALALASVAGIAVVPRALAARTLQRAVDALGKAHSLHVTQWLESSGGVRQTFEIWQDGNQQRIEEDGGQRITLFDGKRVWRYDARQKRTTVRAARSLAAYPSSGPTIAHLRSDLSHWGWKDRLEFLPDASENGRPVRRVRLSRVEPAGPLRVEFWVDPTTDLPVRTETFLQTGGVWRKVGAGELRYDEAAAADRRFPLPGPAVDLDEQARLWRTRLATPVARLGKIALRTVEVSPEGNVFVLYTAGKTPEDAFRTDPDGTRWYTENNSREWELALVDDAGVRYARQPILFETGIDPKTHQISLGDRPVVDGQKMEGDWFVPLTAQIPKRSPRRLTLRVGASAATVAPVRIDSVPAWWEQLVGDGSRSAAPLPPEKSIAADAARARADYFVWNATPRDLPTAWRWLEFETRLRPIADPNRSGLHLRRAECLGMWGKLSDARREIEAALAAWPVEWKDRSTLYIDAARIYRSLGDDAPADRLIDRVIAEKPSEREWLEKWRKRLRRW